MSWTWYSYSWTSYSYSCSFSWASYSYSYPWLSYSYTNPFMRLRLIFMSFSCLCIFRFMEIHEPWHLIHMSCMNHELPWTVWIVMREKRGNLNKTRFWSTVKTSSGGRGSKFWKYIIKLSAPIWSYFSCGVGAPNFENYRTKYSAPIWSSLSFILWFCFFTYVMGNIKWCFYMMILAQ